MAANSHLSALEIKEAGSHYTPPELARFLARNICAHFQPHTGAPLRVLDPACGDGELLEALAVELPEQILRSCTLVGMESDAYAIEKARTRLNQISGCAGYELIETDFLDWSSNFRQARLFGARPPFQEFDVVISNPPYVRTQVMGADRSRKLAAQFGLTGRVDLYHAFALAITDVLREGGVLGLLCSNRFLSIQSGAKLRNMLLTTYRLHDVYDLGDTRLFAAAVLPAIVIGTKHSKPSAEGCRFTKVYELRDSLAEPKTIYDNILVAIGAGVTGMVRVPAGLFDIESARLAVPSTSAQPWRLSSVVREKWLDTVDENAPFTFGDLVKIRVGVKTTADNVFIRSAWDSLPEQIRPEPELLKPLLSNDVAAPWWPNKSVSPTRILYTHTMLHHKRVAINLENYPCAARYLEEHRNQLEERKYVIEAGRRWYEIWVPQQPSDWIKPKVVFADISSTPKFYFDTSGAIVDGNCYWFTGDEEDTLYLLLAVANSTFILQFYDAVCGNKLYAGRRRFITQYVQRFPAPDPKSSISKLIIKEVRALLRLTPTSTEAQRKIAQIDDLVWRSFGLVKEVQG